MRVPRLIQRIYKINYSPDQVAEIIESFLDNRLGISEWSSFLSIAIYDPRLDSVRGECLKMKAEFPGRAGDWYSEEGLRRLKALASSLRERRF